MHGVTPMHMHGMHAPVHGGLHIIMQAFMYRYIQGYYSGTFDSGPSEIGTLYNKPLYKGHCSRSQKLHALVHLEPLKEDIVNLSIKDKTAGFILSPMCPLFGGSTVYIA